MIFIDTNVIMYTVGGDHPLRAPCRIFFEEALRENAKLVTSAEVVQELLHAYVPVARYSTLDLALTLIEQSIAEIWPLEFEDVSLAYKLNSQFPLLDARDLCHLACCRRRGVKAIKTYDKSLAAAIS
jgi:predicted nucleic acid-binding protein